MNRWDVIATLERHAPQLRARGVRHAALFGSLARGDAHADSDIDILVELEPDIVRDIYAYAGLKSFIAELFTTPVDVIDRAGLSAHIRTKAIVDEIRAF